MTMYEELLRMELSNRTTITERLDRLAKLPSKVNYLQWFRVLDLLVAVWLVGYTLTWLFEPTVGVIAWANANINPHTSEFLALWAILSASMLVNHASVKTLMEYQWYFVAFLPFGVHGVLAVISGIAWVASFVHVMIGITWLVIVFFRNDTIAQFAREARKTAELERDLNIMQKKLLDAQDKILKLEQSTFNKVTESD